MSFQKTNLDLTSLENRVNQILAEMARSGILLLVATLALGYVSASWLVTKVKSVLSETGINDK